MADEGDESEPQIQATSSTSVQCPLHLMHNILQDIIERAKLYDNNILRQRSLLRQSRTKRMVQREVVLRKPKLILRHGIEVKGPHEEIRYKQVPAPPTGEEEGEEGGEAPPPPPPAEGEEGEEPVEQIPMVTVEENVHTCWVGLDITQMGTVASEMESVDGEMRFTVDSTCEELSEFTISLKIRTTSSDVPEGLQQWVESLTSGIKDLAEKMVYLSPILENSGLFSERLYRLILEKAKRFKFMSQSLSRSPSAQSCLLDGTARGSLLRSPSPPRPMSSLN